MLTDERLAELERRARSAYAAPGRVYHDTRHLDHCLFELAGVEGLQDSERRLLRLALLYHDIVYDPKRGDNEERSAELAERDLKEAGADTALRAEVVRLILLTKGHMAAPDDHLGRLMVSIDLAILGSSPDRYAEYADGIRKEYAHVPDPLYRTGRSEVLQRFLEREAIFPDPEFRRRYEKQTRANLADELKRLSPRG